jgi:hypothetical protein
MINYRLLKKYVIFLFCCSIVFFCKDIETEKKIAPSLRLHLKNQKAASQLDQLITIIFKVNEDINDSHVQVLRKNDIKIISNIGFIYTASLPARNILYLAKMKFVEYIERPQKFKTTTRDTTQQLPTLKEF